MEIDVQLKGDGIGVGEEIRLARLLEDAGFERLWHAEAYRDAFVPLAAIAASTRSLGLGTAVAQWTRTPPNMELTAASLDELCPRGFWLGIGSMPASWNEDWHGISFERPLRRMREYVEALRVLWTAGIDAPVDYDGEVFQIRRYFRYNGPLERPIPILLGATRPGMARLAGEIADGVIFNGQLSASYIRDVMRPVIEEGRARGGREGPFHYCASLPTAVSEDHDEAYRWVKHDIAMHIGVAGYFEALAAHHGFSREHDAILEAFRDGRHAEAVAAVPDAMVDEFALAGTAEEVRAKVGAYEGIADRVILSSPGFLRESGGTVRNYEAVAAAFAR